MQSYREFIGELVDVIEALPQLLQHAAGVVNMGSVAERSMSGSKLTVDDLRRAAAAAQDLDDPQVMGSAWQ